MLNARDRFWPQLNLHEDLGMFWAQYSISLGFTQDVSNLSRQWSRQICDILCFTWLNRFLAFHTIFEIILFLKVSSSGGETKSGWTPMFFLNFSSTPSKNNKMRVFVEFLLRKFSRKETYICCRINSIELESQKVSSTSDVLLLNLTRFFCV